MVPWHVLTHAILAWNGITPQDICCSVNDTTTAAVATGRLLGRGEDGNCMMHMCNLVAGHALVGKRVRTQNRVIIDESPDIGALVRKKIQLIIKYISHQRRQSSASLNTRRGTRMLVRKRPRWGLIMTHELVAHIECFSK